MKICNLVLLAHVDAGKTTLTEQLLYHCGEVRQAGSVDQGSTQTDWLPIEQERGISVKTSSVSVQYRNIRLNLIDTPGHMDFSGEVERALYAADACILLVSAVEGIQSQTWLFWEAIRTLQIPCLIFVNKVDRAGAQPEGILEQLRQEFLPVILPLCQVSEAGTAACEILPAPLTEDGLLLLCDCDEDLADRYLSGEVITEETAHDRLAEACAHAMAYPLVYGAAAQGRGIASLLDAIDRYLPCPEADCSKEVSGVVYRIEHDKAMGKIAHIRLFDGALHNRDAVTLHRNGQEAAISKITVIRQSAGAKQKDTGRLLAGDIGAVYGLSDARTGDTVGSPHPLRQYPLAHALFTVQASAGPGQQTDLLRAVTELADEDPLLDYDWLADEQELHLKITGKIQLEILYHLFLERYGLTVTFSPPGILYRETPLKKARGLERYTMPKPCWAVVELEIEPLPRGSGFLFETVNIPHDQLFPRYRSHIQASIPGALRQGRLGWEVTDLKVTLVGGEHHLVHTHPLDFFLATPIAVHDALQNSGTRLLEPVLRLQITAPEEYSGKLIGDILTMRGSFNESSQRNGKVFIEALVPAAEAGDYAAQFASLTGGRGNLRSVFSGYQDCPDGVTATAKRGEIDPLDRSKWILYKRSAIH